MRRIQSIEQKTEKQWDKHKEKNTKKNKDKMNAERREKRKTIKQRRTVTNQTKVVHACLYILLISSSL